jgi:hypothetical protein
MKSNDKSVKNIYIYINNSNINVISPSPKTKSSKIIKFIIKLIKKTIFN